MVYNLSPSFNWSAHGFSGAEFVSRVKLSDQMTEDALKSFVWDLAKEGYVYLCSTDLKTHVNLISFVLQLISLAGLHSTATVTGT